MSTLAEREQLRLEKVLTRRAMGLSSVPSKKCSPPASAAKPKASGTVTATGTGRCATPASNVPCTAAAAPEPSTVLEPAVQIHDPPKVDLWRAPSVGNEEQRLSRHISGEWKLRQKLVKSLQQQQEKPKTNTITTSEKAEEQRERDHKETHDPALKASLGPVEAVSTSTTAQLTLLSFLLDEILYLLRSTEESGFAFDQAQAVAIAKKTMEAKDGTVKFITTCKALQKQPSDLCGSVVADVETLAVEMAQFLRTWRDGSGSSDLALTGDVVGRVRQLQSQLAALALFV